MFEVRVMNVRFATSLELDAYRAVWTKGLEVVLYVAHAFQKIPPARLPPAATHRVGRWRSRDAEAIHNAKTRECNEHNQGPEIIAWARSPFFADLGLSRAEKHRLKAALVVQLQPLVAGREIMRTEGLKLIEMKQPRL